MTKKKSFSMEKDCFFGPSYFEAALEQIFFTVGQNNFGNKIPFPLPMHLVPHLSPFFSSLFLPFFSSTTILSLTAQSWLANNG